MGLDSVEIVMEVEEEFQLCLPERGCEECRTVQDLVSLVHSQLKSSGLHPCPSQCGFYILRRAFVTAIGIPKASIRPDTLLETLVDRGDRQEKLNCVAAAIPPDKQNFRERDICSILARPLWMSRLVFLVFPAITLPTLLILFFILMGLGWESLWTALLLSLLSTMAAMFTASELTEPYRIVFPKRYSAIKDLLPLVVMPQTKTWSEDEVFSRVQPIITDLMGLKPSQVRLESRFIEDLGMD